MAIRRRRALAAAGIDVKTFDRALRKDLRGMQQVIGPLLDRDEELINFYKQSATSSLPTQYIVLTDRAIRVMEMAADGAVRTFDHQALVGLRMRSGLIRLTYVYGGSGNIHWPTFGPDGGPTVTLALYTQLRKAWEKHTGREMPQSYVNSRLVPRFSFEPSSDDALDEEDAAQLARQLLWINSHIIRATLPISIQTIADMPAEAPAAFDQDDAPRQDRLVWLGDDGFALLTSLGGVAEIQARKLTAIRITNRPGTGGASSFWEFGWTEDDQEWRAFFEGPGIALVDGVIGHSADRFLRESRLRERAPMRDSQSWIPAK